MRGVGSFGYKRQKQDMSTAARVQTHIKCAYDDFWLKVYTLQPAAGRTSAAVKHLMSACRRRQKIWRNAVLLFLLLILL